MDYFNELYENIPRSSPGDKAATVRALALIKDLPAEPLILDLGCGPGEQTLELARLTNGRVIAIDSHRPFLDRLEAAAYSAGLGERIQVRDTDTAFMDFTGNSFDLIWSEGALSFLGFENGLKISKTLVKKGGHIAVSKPLWLKPDPPAELKTMWEAKYPSISDLAGDLALFQKLGLDLVGHFPLPAG
jgi:SAM-dependent methyltransferase